MDASFVPVRRLALICTASVLVLIFAWRQGQPPTLSSPWSLPVPAPLAGNTGDPSGLNMGGIVFNAQPAGQSVPLTTQGDVGFNVLAALNASGGALRDVTIAPGATWSFNAAIGNPGGVELRTVGGVLGGGWCDLAARYVQAVRPLLPNNAVTFVNHVDTSGIGLADVAHDDAVSIWNVNGQAGFEHNSQDLLITNALAHPLHLQALPTPDGAAIMVQATVLDS